MAKRWVKEGGEMVDEGNSRSGYQDISMEDIWASAARKRTAEVRGSRGAEAKMAEGRTMRNGSRPGYQRSSGQVLAMSNE